ncbi:hypothetical protein [Carboxylicivirga linearis]|uniref:HEPN domain-containing protein n=1 Tax=Carboxylicivirga linearis TaxID=1628157 RepID=A0ABS5JWA0_9BACT|nr:hypothetical protein [Carboxylicivirga linearis]MBS2098754.1 hypothetical protein [Carboxylicivirga linearis]
MMIKENNWKNWLAEGDQYLNGMPKPGKPSKFGTDIRYNMLSMGFESYVMAILDFKDNLPDNHTFSDLVYGLEREIDLDLELKERILKYESIQEICSLDKYTIKQPSEDEITDLHGAILEIKVLAHQICKEPA